MFCVPNGSEGRGVETFPSACNAQTIGAQSIDALQVPPTAFNPQQLLGTVQPTQPVDMLGTTSGQSAALAPRLQVSQN